MPQGGGAYPGVRAGEMLRAGRRVRGAPARPGLADRRARAGRLRADAVQAALRRPAAAARAGLRDRRPARAGVPRRADGRAGPAGAPPRVGAGRRAAPRRRRGAAHHAPDGGGRGARRPRRDRRPRAGRRRGQPGGAHHGAATRSCGSAPAPGWTWPGWPPRCPPATGAAETLAGRYVVQGRIDPAVLSAITGVVRGAGRAGRRRPGRPAQPRGRVPRADRPGAAVVSDPRFAARHLHPAARRAVRPARMLAAQAATELRLALRNGEQVLLTLRHPGAAAGRAHRGRRRPAARAAGRRGHAVGAGARGDVDGVHQPGHRAGLRPALRGDPAARGDGAAALAARGGPAGRGARDRRRAGRRARRCSPRRSAGARRSRAWAGRCCWCCSAAPRSGRWACCSAARCGPRSCWRSRTPCGSCCCWRAGSSCRWTGCPGRSPRWRRCCRPERWPRGCGRP